MALNEPLVRVDGSNVSGVAFMAGFTGGALAALVLGWMVGHPPAAAMLVQLLPTGEKTAWYLSRSSGVVAYLLLSASMVWGLALSTKIMRDFVSPPLAMALHSSLSWFAIGLAAFHAVALLFDDYYQYTMVDLIVPFLGPYRPLVVGVGILSFYGLILIATSFAARKRLGQRTWRRLHYLSFVLYLLVTAHGLLAGSDSSSAILRGLYLDNLLTLLFLVNYRLLTLPDAKASRAARAAGDARSAPGTLEVQPTKRVDRRGEVSANLRV